MKPELLRGSTMKFGRVGRAYVCIHPDLAPSDADWKALMADVEQQARQISGLFVYAAEGGGPNAVHRKQIIEMWARVGRPPPIAVVASSPAVRAMITAINYFLPRPIREFSLDAMGEALEYVGVPPSEHPLLRGL